MEEPLHLVCGSRLLCSGSALEIIQYIVCAWPESIQQRAHPSCELSLPLHCMLRQEGISSIDIMQFLVAQWPKAVKIPGVLHDAIRSEASFPVVKLLVEQWPEALGINDGNELPLHTACFEPAALTATIRYLIDIWPHALEVVDASGHLPLHLAFCNNLNNIELIQLLISKWPHAVQFTSPYNNELPLHMAHNCNAPLAVVQTLISAWPYACCVQDDEGYLLHPHGVLRNLNNVIVFLAESCLETTVTSGGGYLPLHWACIKKVSTSIIEALIQADLLSVRVLAYNEGLPLHLACLNDDPDRETIECLVWAWPESTMVSVTKDDGYSYRPIDILLHQCLLPGSNSNESYEKILLLTNWILPFHIVSTYSPQLYILQFLNYLEYLFPECRLHFHNGMLPFHCACRAGALNV